MRLYTKRFESSSFLFQLFLRQPELAVAIPVEMHVKIARTGAVTVRLDPELKGRLAQAAAKLDLSENDIVRHALRAAVNAIEANDYKIELPLEMALANAPIESRITGRSEPEGKHAKGKRQ
jgi:antitoxin component of RelBE/YafQ-DinJ toxin-antitoxin module